MNYFEGKESIRKENIVSSCVFLCVDVNNFEFLINKKCEMI